MKTKYVGKNIEVTESLKDYTEKKLGKISKFFPNEVEVLVMMKIVKAMQEVEFTIHHDGLTIRSEVATDDMYNSIDKAVDILTSQIIKQKTRFKKANKFLSVPQELFGEEEKEEVKKIVKRKNIELIPMTEEEAILQMELLNHDMFIFMDGYDGNTKVLYRRKDGQYGLIATY